MLSFYIDTGKGTSIYVCAAIRAFDMHCIDKHMQFREKKHRNSNCCTYKSIAGCSLAGKQSGSTIRRGKFEFRVRVECQ